MSDVEVVEPVEELTFREKVVEKATLYLDDVAPSDLSVDLAIEQFRDCRSYPKSYSEEMILADMEKNISKITMAVVEIESKNGAEGETSHNESGTNRSYGTNPLPKAYATVVQFANVF